jgi:vancomycin permeability regulator SanA
MSALDISNDMKKTLKSLKICFLFGLGLCGLYFGAIFWYGLQIEEQLLTPPNKTCAVVFGAAVWKDDIPSQVLYDRTQGALELFLGGRANCLIFSGGASRYGAHEVDVMVKMAREKGIPERALFRDYEGTSTERTIQNLSNFTFDKAILVSSDFHLARIKLLAVRAGLKNVSLHRAKTQYRNYEEKWFSIGREFIGLLWYSREALLGLFLCLLLWISHSNKTR